MPTASHGNVSYITLARPDVDGARRFYRTVLGADLEQTRPMIGLRDAVVARVDTEVVLSWQVDDLVAAVVAVRAAGGSADEPEDKPYGRQATCSDGRGLRFWLHQLAEDAPAVGDNGDRPGDISYLVLQVADLDHARQLFGDVLGWRFEPSPAGAQVEGCVPMTGISQGEPGAELCFRVDDIAAAVARVTEAGGRPGPVETRPYGLEAHCADDQGVQFYLHQFPS